jgi:hypothetical protein
MNLLRLLFQFGAINPRDHVRIKGAVVKDVVYGLL